MSDKKTVFVIMRDLGVDYETIVEIAQSAKINVIKSPNTEVSPRHLKKILVAAEKYKSAQKAAEAPKIADTPEADIAIDSTALEAPVAQSAEEPASQSGEAPAAQSGEVPAAQSAEAAVAQSAEAAVAQSAEAPVVQSAEAPVVQSAEAPVAQSEAAPAAQSEEASVIQSKEAPMAKDTEVSATQSEKTPEVKSKEKRVSQRTIKREIIVKRPGDKGNGSQMATMTGRSISLEQLQARTGSPGSGRGGNSRRNDRGGDRNNQRSPRTPRTPRAEPNLDQIITQVPEAANPNKETRRRVRVTPKPEDLGERQKNARNSSRRRQEVQQQDIYGGGRYGSHRSRRKSKGRKGAKVVLTTPAAHKRVVRVDETMSVGELGKVMGVKSADLIRKLMDLEVMATINQQLDFATIELIAPEFKFEANKKSNQATT